MVEPDGWSKQNKLPNKAEYGGHNEILVLVAGTALTVAVLTPGSSVEFSLSLLPLSQPFSSLSLLQEMRFSYR